MGEGLKRARAAAKATREPAVILRGDYEVAGGAIRDGIVSAIDVIGEEMDGGGQRAVTLYLPRGELGFYPIGAKVRITVERLK